jgi:hypothetical protein
VTPPVKLGPNSPLLTKAGARRRLGPDESDIQIALLELLVGRSAAGEGRVLGRGMTQRYPELSMIYAINPNKGGQRSKAARGKAKAMGLLPDMPDLCLPVARGPFYSLYVEMKRPGTYGSAAQRERALDLRAHGHAVFECQTVEEAAQVIVGYLALGIFSIDTRDTSGYPHPLDEETSYNRRDRLHYWRAKATELLTPKRR